MAYDIVTSLRKLMRNRALGFVLDFLMLVAFALTFFSFLIGYNSGQIRVLLLLFTLAGVTAYMFTFHRVLERVFDKMLLHLRKNAKKLAKKLKISKKY